MGFWTGLLVGWATSGFALLAVVALCYAGAKRAEDNEYRFRGE